MSWHEYKIWTDQSIPLILDKLRLRHKLIPLISFGYNNDQKPIMQNCIISQNVNGDWQYITEGYVTEKTEKNSALICLFRSRTKSKAVPQRYSQPLKQSGQKIVKDIIPGLSHRSTFIPRNLIGVLSSLVTWSKVSQVSCLVAHLNAQSDKTSDITRLLTYQVAERLFKILLQGFHWYDDTKSVIGVLASLVTS